MPGHYVTVPRVTVDSPDPGQSGIPRRRFHDPAGGQVRIPETPTILPPGQTGAGRDRDRAMSSGAAVVARSIRRGSEPC